MTRILPWLLLAAACGGGPGSGGPVLLQNKGSDTMVNLMQRMSENYQKKNPGVIVAVTGGGSGTGIKSMIDGTTDLANSSRSMKPEEIETAKKNGRDPHETAVAYDGLAIYVHKDNPVAQISFDELKCIYAADGTCNEWSDLGVTVDCNGTDAIVKVGRQNNSGTYEYFHEAVIGKEGRFTNTMDQSGTQQVVDVVSTSKCAIGYGGMGYTAPNVRDVCLSKDKGAACVEPKLETVLAGQYPFSRPLFVYTNGAPTGEAKAFLDWILSDEGQKLVVEAGFVPVPKK
jgi:phosphate transport system substrate-binding protein